jgi:hypothetical protein
MFCYVMSDLDACIRSTWHYHQLRIASLIRLLAIDEQPLAIQVNRTHRLRIAYSHGPGLLKTAPATGTLERDGISASAACRFGVLALDEGLGDERPGSHCGECVRCRG